MSKLLITADRLRELLRYNPETGVFTRAISTSSNARSGSVAGSIKKDGYLRIWIDGKSYFSHRLAWLYVHGEWPPNCIDHINGVTSDNRYSNLRLATRTQNLGNSKIPVHNISGLKGASLHRKKWVAQIHFKGEKYHLGLFTTPEEAHAAYCAAAKRHFGDFARFA